jgi:hypothetical protein
MWKVFRDKEGWFISVRKPYPMPSRRRATKELAQAEADRRNDAIEAYEKQVLQGTAGFLPGSRR